jgi:hypothetical protein
MAVIKLKGNTTTENAPPFLEQREIAVNEVTGKLYMRRQTDTQDPSSNVVCVGGNDGLVIYSDASPSDNSDTYLLLSADEALEIRKITFLLEEGALTGGSLKKRIHNQPLTEGAGLQTIVTFNANTDLQSKDIFNENETDVNPANAILNIGDGLLINTGIGADPSNFTLQITFRVFGVAENLEPII